MLACNYIAPTSRVGPLWPRHTAQLAFSGLEYDNRTKLFWTLNLTIGHSEIYMGCPLVPCSHVVADSGKILLEPSKTFCHNCSTMSCQSCPWGHEMGGNHSGKTCPSPDYAKGFTAHVTNYSIYHCLENNACKRLQMWPKDHWRTSFVSEAAQYTHDWNGQTIITILSVGKNLVLPHFLLRRLLWNILGCKAQFN